MDKVEANGYPILNPSDLPEGRRYRYGRGKELYRMWSNVGDHGYVWSDSAEDAFEEWVEYLDEESPGVFETVDVDDLKAAAEDLDIEWQDSWPDLDDEDFQKVAEEAEADLDTIGHTTLKSGSHISKDAWGFDEVSEGSDEYSKVWCACAKAYFADNGEWPDKPDDVECPEMDGVAVDMDLDGVRAPRSMPAWIRRGR
jgi:hypothetical protein